MDQITYADIKAECLEFDAYLQQRNKDKLALVKEIGETLGRYKVASFTDFLKEKLPHADLIESYLPSPSSDEISDLVSNDEEEEKRKIEKGFYSTVFYDKIEGLLIDTRTLVEAVNKDNCKNLMLQGIPETLDYFEFVKFKDTLRKHPPNFSAVHFCFYDSKYSLILEFEDSFGAQKFYESCKKKELPNFKNFLGDRFDLKWVDNTDKVNNERKVTIEKQLYDKVFGAHKKSKSLIFYSPDFIGVVLRNVPSNYDCSEIVSLLREKNVKAEISQTCKFADEIFVLLQFASIEEAELAVFFLHLKVISGHEMKASIHKKSNYFRKPEKQRYFKDLFVQREYDEDKISKIIEVVGQKDGNEKSDNEAPMSPYAYLNKNFDQGNTKQSIEKERKQNHAKQNIINRYKEDHRYDHKRSNYDRTYEAKRFDNNHHNKNQRSYDERYNNYRKDDNRYNNNKRERKRSRSYSENRERSTEHHERGNGNNYKQALDSSLSLSSSRSKEKQMKRDHGKEYNKREYDYRDNQHRRRDDNDKYNKGRSAGYKYRD